MGVLDRHDIADLRDTEQGGNPGRHVFSERGGRQEYVAVTGGNLRNLWCQDGSQCVSILRTGDSQYLADVLDFRRFGRDGVRRIR